MSTLRATRDDTPGGATRRAARLGTIRARSRTLRTCVVLIALTLSVGSCKVGELTQTPPPNGTAATRLVFTVQPSTTRVQAAITPAVRVAAQDELGNIATSFTGTVTIALGSNPAGGTLGGTRTGVATQGVATFPSISVNKPGSGYTLAAAASGLTAAASGAFDIMPGAPGKLAFTTSPSASAQSGVPFAQQPAVQLEDSAGNPVAQAGTLVTATLASGPSGASLGGDTTRTNAKGVAAFSGLAISGATGTYTISCTASGLVAVTSGAIALAAGPAAKLVVVTEPSATVQSGVAFSQQPVVQLADAAGNPVGEGGAAVTATIATGSPALSGTNPVTTNASGSAAFTNLVITGSPGARTLAFSASGVAGVTSAAVSVAGAPATQIAASAGNNQTAAAGSAVPVAPAVLVEDQTGTPVAGVSVTFAVLSGGGSVTGAAATTNASGIASVGSWTLGTSVGTNTLSATASGLTGSPVQFTATATAGPPASVAIEAGNAQSATVNSAVTTPPGVIVRDRFGNPVAGVAVSFVVASGGGSLTQASPTTSAGGIASVGSWTLGTAAGSNTLTATASGVSGSVSFNATGVAGPPSATQSALSAAPATITASSGASAATISVTVRDAYGNPVSGASVAIAASGAGNTLTQSSTTSNVAGQVSATLSSTVAGTKTIGATASSVTLAATPSVTVTPGPAAELLFTGQPTDTRASAPITPPVVVTAVDAFGNTASTYTGVVTVSITPGTGTPLAVLSGTTSVSASGGVASFGNLSINLASTVTPYRLDAASSGLGGATSTTFNITP